MTSLCRQGLPLFRMFLLDCTKRPPEETSLARRTKLGALKRFFRPSLP
jgi:hypothetical protein